MNHVLKEFCWLFWISVMASLACSLLAGVVLRRRKLWLRYLDAEEALWIRLKLPQKIRASGRRFAESRWFAIFSVIFALVYLLLAALSAGLYFHFRHRLHS